VFTARYGLIAYKKTDGVWSLITVVESVYSAVWTDPYIKQMAFGL